MLPFTREQFFAIFLEYNNTVWPASILACGLGILALIAVLQPKPVWSKLTASILAMMWAWTGVAYHGFFFSMINSAAILFAALFVAQSLLFAYFGLIRDRLRFGESRGYQAAIGWAFIGYALIAYPLIGIAMGHSYDALPQFGITPCPVTLFTFGLLLGQTSTAMGITCHTSGLVIDWRIGRTSVGRSTRLVASGKRRHYLGPVYSFEN